MNKLVYPTKLDGIAEHSFPQNSFHCYFLQIQKLHLQFPLIIFF